MARIKESILDREPIHRLLFNSKSLRPYLFEDSDLVLFVRLLANRQAILKGIDAENLLLELYDIWKVDDATSSERADWRVQTRVAAYIGLALRKYSPFVGWIIEEISEYNIKEKADEIISVIGDGWQYKIDKFDLKDHFSNDQQQSAFSILLKIYSNFFYDHNYYKILRDIVVEEFVLLYDRMPEQQIDKKIILDISNSKNNIDIANAKIWSLVKPLFNKSYRLFLLSRENCNLNHFVNEKNVKRFVEAQEKEIKKPKASSSFIYDEAIGPGEENVD